MKFPRSPYDREQDIVYFPRMTDKIRMHQCGDLPSDYHANLGRGFDQRCCDFLGVDYDDLAVQVGAGKSDAEVLEWCFEHGRRPAMADIFMWNEFLRKCGWNDDLSSRVRERLAGLGLSDRTDIVTIFDLIEVDEGRSPRGGKL
ncbi:MAG: DUF5069 domain-containing protein [Chthoniobacterales bacterium]|nr:DUF5069 domain-containing protein [Chthoniobacterales bacterium]